MNLFEQKKKSKSRDPRSSSEIQGGGGVFHLMAKRKLMRSSAWHKNIHRVMRCYQYRVSHWDVRCTLDQVVSVGLRREVNLFPRGKCQGPHLVEKDDWVAPLPFQNGDRKKGGGQKAQREKSVTARVDTGQGGRIGCRGMLRSHDPIGEKGQIKTNQNPPENL